MHVYAAVCGYVCGIVYEAVLCVCVCGSVGAALRQWLPVFVSVCDCVWQRLCLCVYVCVRVRVCV